MEKKDDNLTASERITRQVQDLGDWRGETLARLRSLVLNAVPGVIEEWKWGTGVWSLNGNLLAIAAMKSAVKMNFFKGASLPDPHGLFNAGLEAKESRSIDFHRGDAIQEAELAELIQAAAALNQAGKPKK